MSAKALRLENAWTLAAVAREYLWLEVTVKGRVGAAEVG